MYFTNINDKPIESEEDLNAYLTSGTFLVESENWAKGSQIIFKENMTCDYNDSMGQWKILEKAKI